MTPRGGSVLSAFSAPSSSALAVAVLMLLFQTPILHLLGARDDTIAYAGAYYRFLVLGCPAIIFNIVPGNLLRTEGLANDA